MVAQPENKQGYYMKSTKRALLAGLLAMVLLCSTSNVHAEDGKIGEPLSHACPYEYPSPTTTYWNDVCYWAWQASIAISYQEPKNKDGNYEKMA